MYKETPLKLAPERVIFNHQGFKVFFPRARLRHQPFGIQVAGDAPWTVHRPETVESLYVLWATTRQTHYRDQGWRIFEALEKWAAVCALCVNECCCVGVARLHTAMERILMSGIRANHVATGTMTGPKATFSLRLSSIFSCCSMMRIPNDWIIMCSTLRRIHSRYRVRISRYLCKTVHNTPPSKCAYLYNSTFVFPLP